VTLKNTAPVLYPAIFKQMTKKVIEQ